MCVLASEQKKCLALSVHPHIELALLVPRKWKFNYQTVWLQKKHDPHFKIFVGNIICPGYGHRSLYLTGLAKALHSFKPHIIHLFQEPWSFSALQVATYRTIFSPQSKFIFLTWENIYRNFWYYYRFSKVYSIIDRSIHKTADGAVAISQDAKSVLLRKGFKKRIAQIPWGTDIQLFKKRSVDSLKKALSLNGSFIIGFIGRLVEVKGVPVLLKAVSRLAGNYKLLIVGDGPLKDSIKKSAEELGISHKLIWVASVSHNDISAYINCMDLLVLPSITTPVVQEQFGKVLIEAMSCEVPVVGSSSGSIPEVIGDAGLIFEENNDEELREKIELLMNNHLLRKRLAQQGRQQVLKNYSWEKVTERLVQFYQRVVLDSTENFIRN